MAEFCLNRVTIRHKDPRMMKRLLDAYARGAVCREFLPLPTSVNASVNWAVYNWGTKWDFGVGELGDPAVTLGNGAAKLDFHTAWSPPLGLYVELIEQGFEIEVRYCELSEGFCGRVDQRRIRHFEIRSGNFSKIQKHVDAVLIEEFGLDDFYADEEDEEDDDGSGSPWVTDMDLATFERDRAEHYAAFVENMKQFKVDS